MLRNYFFINLFLLVIVCFLGIKFYEAYTRTTDIPKEAAVKQIQKESEQVKSEERPIDPSLFQIISNMDIFRPARSPYKEDASQQALPKIPPRLFGTIILGGEKTAILEDPNTKSTRTYSVNEQIGGYVISEILEDRIVLSSNGEKSEVRLREEKKGLPPLRQQIIPPPSTPQVSPQPDQPQVQPQPVIPQRPVQRPPQRPRPVPLPQVP